MRRLSRWLFARRSMFSLRFSIFLKFLFICGVELLFGIYVIIPSPESRSASVILNRPDLSQTLSRSWFPRLSVFSPSKHARGRCKTTDDVHRVGRVDRRWKNSSKRRQSYWFLTKMSGLRRRQAQKEATHLSIPSYILRSRQSTLPSPDRDHPAMHPERVLTRC